MYRLTLINPDGALVAEVPDSPVLPRFMHVYKDDDDGQGRLELSDQPDPGQTVTERVVSFARVASAVWVDDDRAALFVRVAS